MGGNGVGTVYTDVMMIRSLWKDLLAGKNLDMERLAGDGQRSKPKSERSAFSPDKPISQATEEKVRAATVRIRLSPTDRGFSGVVVTPDAVVATCAHGFKPDKSRLATSKVIVCFPDGRDAAAKILGFNIVCDVGLVQITDRGPWPHVERGDSTRMRSGDRCLLVGYGLVGGRHPKVLHSVVAAQSTVPWNQCLELDPSTRIYSGDSGGGVFDARGRVVGLLLGTGPPRKPGRPESMPLRSARIELLRTHWDEMQGPFEAAQDSAFAVVDAELRRAAVDLKHSVVEVLDGKKPVSLGTVTRPDGIILTEASTVPKHPACRLSDGRVLPATVVKTALEHDLAVLKVEATHLPAIKWSTDGHPAIGTLVGVAAPGRRIAVGLISHAPFALAPELCGLHVDLRDTARGLEVARVDDWRLRRRAPQPKLLKGDIVLSIDGHPTPNLDAYRKIWQVDRIASSTGVPVCHIMVRRGMNVEKLELPLEMSWPGNDLRYRYSGFPLAYSVTTEPDTNLCGGPVLDANGHAVGIGIAWRARGWLLALPAATAKALTSD
jgi:S1-C subfamily serine protease